MLADDKFESEPKNGCDLLVQITEDSFSYAIIDQKTEKPKRLFSIQGKAEPYQEINQLFETDPFLSLDFASVKVGVQTSSFVFIPEHLYDTNQKKKFNKFLVETNNVREYHHEDLKLISLFSINNALVALLPARTKFLSALAPLAACVTQKNSDCFLVDFGSESVSFLYFKDGKFQFYNNFSVSDVEEFNYFILLVKQQLNIEVNTLILVQGLVDDGDDYFKRLTKYFLNVKLNRVEKIVYNEIIDELPTHYFNSLLSLQLCE